MKTLDAVVIGAGPSGLASARQCLKRGLSVRVVEQLDDVGGNWLFAPRNEHSSVAKWTFANTSKQIMAFSELEMPPSFPDYPHQEQLLCYLRGYAESMGIREHTTFGFKVHSVEQTDAGFVVRSDSGAEVHGKTLWVASGHHWHPRRPQIPGEFSGEAVHAKHYRSGDAFAGRRVLLVGLGASGADIAVDLSHRAARVDVSVRRGYHIVPKYVMGRPLDHFAFEKKKSVLPAGIRAKLTDRLLMTLIGNPKRFGFPPVEHGFRAVSPTISQELLGRLGEGSVKIVPGVRRFDHSTATFVDGTSRDYDCVIYATGYDVRFPFLPPPLRTRAEALQLYRHVVHPEAEGLFFLGLVQPLGSFWPVAEAQAAWLADMMLGVAPRTTPGDMARAVDASYARFGNGNGKARELYMQVDQEQYLLELWRAMTPEGPDRSRRVAARRVAPFMELARNRIAAAK